MINLIPSFKKLITQAPKAQELENMKIKRHEMHMGMLGLKHLKQLRDEE